MFFFFFIVFNSLYINNIHASLDEGSMPPAVTKKRPSTSDDTHELCSSKKAAIADKINFDKGSWGFATNSLEDDPVHVRPFFDLLLKARGDIKEFIDNVCTNPASHTYVIKEGIMHSKKGLAYIFPKGVIYFVSEAENALHDSHDVSDGSAIVNQ